MTPESKLLGEIRLILGREPGLVLWHNSAGVAKYGDSKVRYGLCRGASDLIGIGPGGRFVALEIKSARGRVSVEQKLFLALVTRMGGFAAVLRSVEDAWAALEALRARE